MSHLSLFVSGIHINKAAIWLSIKCLNVDFIDVWRQLSTSIKNVIDVLLRPEGPSVLHEV